MSSPLPPDDFNPPTGAAMVLEPGLRRVLCPNPSPMTYRGTNTYILGDHGLAVIDPGPENASHLQAILDAVQPGQEITHIFVTHSHVDHSPLTRALSKASGAPVLALGDWQAGRSEVMQQLAAGGLAGGGEGVDAAFHPDITLTDGETVDGDGWSLRAIHTPGHYGNHLSFEWDNALFCGDHVMGWASSLVSPPDGDLTDFMASCARLQRRKWRVFHSGHGAPIADPAGRLDWLISHRNAREAEILTRLSDGPATAYALATSIYTDVPAALIGAATRNVFAHLVDLTLKRRVSSSPRLSADAEFRLI
ncbi:MBL fold metallo-hydrolase [Alisedimentitalea sp. MJ-SS2]|uniref:MBL fold metallo-hydrolase n=1 Tax=Aliisedimentitalea sp. MJ-SS2 TaxID=3049795 RepID=UPI00290DDA64|nr:MBL fold metallo-hydrolase [Alisedimentitalea sp. MJ-SS2]MDU8926776.1 MBL fold metallo-hydrolase [Alisedimentitalea sp. MJ-SS2]